MQCHKGLNSRLSPNHLPRAGRREVEGGVWGLVIQHLPEQRMGLQRGVTALLPPKLAPPCSSSPGTTL